MEGVESPISDMQHAKKCFQEAQAVFQVFGEGPEIDYCEKRLIYIKEELSVLQSP
jgi:hypothetical protein